MRKGIVIGILCAAYIAAAIIFTASDRNVFASSNDASALPTPAKGKAMEMKRDVVLIDVWDGTKLEKSDADWKKELTPNEYYVLRKEGTERAYTGELTENKKEGTYYCAACGLALFRSKAKYDSETGWPSFFEPISKVNVGERVDRSIPSEERTEVHCNRCGGHLGHVFDDGPQPTGLRYCMNSIALRFKPAK